MNRSLLNQATTALRCRRRLFPLLTSPSVVCLSATAVTAPARHKGDYGFNVFHNSNPQHGGSYARHERRMRDDEVEDLMRSVKGWRLVREVTVAAAEAELADMAADAAVVKARRLAPPPSSSSPIAAAMAAIVEGRSSSSSMINMNTKKDTDTNRGTYSRNEDDDDDMNNDNDAAAGDNDVPPEASALRLGEEAIQRTFAFDSFGEAYLFMGRFWAFCYGSDKYPPVTWDGLKVTVFLYSPSFHGLSKREARVAAFLNDQYNMLRKSRWQQGKILEGVARTAVVEDLVGEGVRCSLAAREAERRAPLPEAGGRDGPVDWAALLARSGAGGQQQQQQRATASSSAEEK